MSDINELLNRAYDATSFPPMKHPLRFEESSGGFTHVYDADGRLVLVAGKIAMQAIREFADLRNPLDRTEVPL